MNLIVEPRIGKNNKILDKISSYKPSVRERERLAQLKSHFSVADLIFSKLYEEFNDRSLIQFQNDCQKEFNGYTGPVSTDPALSWKLKVKRGLTRNKVISIAAHITSRVLYPNIIAQNQEDSTDEDMAMIVRDLMEWAGDQSKYPRVFVKAVIAALVNPATIIYEGYHEVIRKYKEIKEDGTWTEKDMMDEVFSGFQNLIVPVDELLIGNIYENDIQKQPFLIWRKFIDYEAAKVKYGKNENFNNFVSPGVRNYYSETEDTFYEQYDEDFEDRLVEEIVYYNRFADLELRIVNGILLDDPDRPLQRKDKRYPFAKNGYEPFDEGKFFYYRPLVDKLKNDQGVIDKLYELIVHGTQLQVMPPMANFGTETVNSNVIIPGAVVNFSDTSAKLEAIGTQRDLNAGYNTLKIVEESANESSQDPMHSGQSASGNQTAFEIAKLEQNAKTVLGLFGKSIIQLVEDFGELRLKTILEKIPVPKVDELLSSSNKIRFAKIIVPERDVDGEKKTRRIEFVDEEELSSANVYEMMKEEDEKGLSIAKVNKDLWKKLSYKVKVNPDFLQQYSEAVKKALNLEAYDRAIQNPLINQDPAKLAKVTKDFLFKNYVEGKEEEYIGSYDDILGMEREAREAREAGQAGGMSGAGGQRPISNRVDQMANVGANQLMNQV